MVKKSMLEGDSVRLGADGFPVTAPGKTKRFRAACVICFSLTAKASLTSKGTYKVGCPNCNSITFLNDEVSVNLWRGWQGLLKSSPEIRELLVNQISTHVPRD